MIQDKNRPALLIDDLSISVGKKQIIKVSAYCPGRTFYGTPWAKRMW